MLAKAKAKASSLFNQQKDKDTTNNLKFRYTNANNEEKEFPIGSTLDKKEPLSTDCKVFIDCENAKKLIELLKTLINTEEYKNYQEFREYISSIEKILNDISNSTYLNQLYKKFLEYNSKLKPFINNTSLDTTIVDNDAIYSHIINTPYHINDNHKIILSLRAIIINLHNEIIDIINNYLSLYSDLAQLNETYNISLNNKLLNLKKTIIKYGKQMDSELESIQLSKSNIDVHIKSILPDSRAIIKRINLIKLAFNIEYTGNIKKYVNIRQNKYDIFYSFKFINLCIYKPLETSKSKKIQDNSCITEIYDKETHNKKTYGITCENAVALQKVLDENYNNNNITISPSIPINVKINNIEIPDTKIISINRDNNTFQINNNIYNPNIDINKLTISANQNNEECTIKKITLTRDLKSIPGGNKTHKNPMKGGNKTHKNPMKGGNYNNISISTSSLC